MLDQDFLEQLEYQLTKAFVVSQSKESRSFWCDGILPPIESEKNILENREILLTAFLGNDGQTKYDLTLKFGNISLTNYIKGMNLSECIPNSNSSDWFHIDISRNKIIVQLL